MLKPKVAFYTLGCKVNQYDTDAVAGQFVAAGYDCVPFDEVADVYVVNTCTVTNMGDRKSRQVIRRAIRANPMAVIAVMGCYAQVSPREIAKIDGVDIVLGTVDRGKLLSLVEESRRIRSAHPVTVVDDVFAVEEFEEPFTTELNSRTRATLKIQEGCNQFCSYCAVPYARGRSRSRKQEAVIDEATRLASKGFKEIVLTGIHLGAYGRELDDELGMTELLYNLHKVEGVERIRISSIDSDEIDDGLIEAVVRLTKVCRHLHIPLQSGDDEILTSMRRRHTTDEFRQTVNRLREQIPEIGVTTDIIVGFPGETEENFRNTLQFVEEMAFSKLHVFPYSKRQGTLAAGMPNQVPRKEKTDRCAELISLGKKLSRKFHEGFVGQTVEVLAEQRQGGQFEGLTDNYLKVLIPSSRNIAGSLIRVRVTAADENEAYGELISL